LRGCARAGDHGEPDCAQSRQRSHGNLPKTVTMPFTLHPDKLAAVHFGVTALLTFRLPQPRVIVSAAIAQEQPGGTR
jgi:hypothetical protein